MVISYPPFSYSTLTVSIFLGSKYRITLVEEDELIGVRICEDNTDAMIITKKGQSIRFMTSSIRNTGRTSIGVRGIRLSKEDEVVSTDLVKNNEYLLVVSENGYGKKTLIQRYNTQNRGGKGVRTYNISEKTGCLVCLMELPQSGHPHMISSI